jgi:hypothetical protein
VSVHRDYIYADVGDRRLFIPRGASRGIPASDTAPSCGGPRDGRARGAPVCRAGKLPDRWSASLRYSERSVAAGSILTARIAAGSAASSATDRRARDGKASIGRSVALT